MNCSAPVTNLVIRTESMKCFPTFLKETCSTYIKCSCPKVVFYTEELCMAILLKFMGMKGGKSEMKVTDSVLEL